jgi:hypothetical protein
MRLQTAILTAKKKFSEKTQTLTSVSINEFLNKFSKGSKRFRTVIDSAEPSLKNPAGLTIVKTLANITDTVAPCDVTLKWTLGSWNKSYLESDLSSFTFKTRNNAIGVGARVAHFDGKSSDKCAFCRSAGSPNNPPRETFTHLFFDCPHTKTVLFAILRKLKMNWDLNDGEFKMLYWYGQSPEKLEKESLLFFYCFRFSIWKRRCRRSLPHPDSVLCNISHLLSNVCARRPKIRNSIQRNNNVSNLLQVLLE